MNQPVMAAALRRMKEDDRQALLRTLRANRRKLTTKRLQIVNRLRELSAELGRVDKQLSNIDASEHWLSD